jgi:hypothetical protein
MLGFAALRDAAASLEGRDSNYFSSALGGFEAARERERLRAQGEAANRNQQMMNLIQMQALARAVGDPALEQFASDGLARIMGGVPTGGAGVTPRVTTGATPPVTPAGGAPGATPSVVQNADQYLDDQAILLDSETGGVNADGTRFETPAPLAPPSEPLPEAAPTPDVSAPTETPAPQSTRVSEAQARFDQAEANIEALISRLPGASDVLVLGMAGLPAGVSPQDQTQIQLLLQQREDAATELREAIEAQEAAEQTSARQAETESRVQPLVGNALDFLVNEDGSINVLGARIAQTAPGLAGGQARLAAAAVTELGSIAAMQGVREAREGGFGGSLSDADILLIQRSGGTFDLSQPEATVETLRRIANQLSPEAQQALFGSQNGGGGENRFVPTDEDLSILERNL